MCELQKTRPQPRAWPPVLDSEEHHCEVNHQSRTKLQGVHPHASGRDRFLDISPNKFHTDAVKDLKQVQVDNAILICLSPFCYLGLLYQQVQLYIDMYLNYRTGQITTRFIYHPLCKLTSVGIRRPKYYMDIQRDPYPHQSIVYHPRDLQSP